MKPIFYFLFFILHSSFLIFYSNAQSYRTDIFSPSIKTLQVNAGNDWLKDPVIQIKGQEFVAISFDEMSVDQSRYTYSITHCNADWTKSSLSPGEYMTGFQNQLLDNYTTSFNTTVDYTHYKLFLPNDDVDFLVSGNYVVHISKEGHEDKPVLAACFSVSEPEQIKTQMKITSNTDIDFNKDHQQLSIEVNYQTNMFSALQELKIYAMQNDRRDTRVLLTAPSGFQPGKITFEHNRNLIFEAGNEYRRFESVSTQYNGLNIQTIRYYNPYYHETLFPDDFRSSKSYLYDEDQDGKFYIRANGANDFDIESDYVFVHFSVPCERPFLENIYILSEAFHNILDERSKMTYNNESKAYEKSVLLKQGLYNYMYVSKKNNASSATTSLIEGNYYQAENKYTIMVYHRPPGGRYDRLVSVHSL